MKIQITFILYLLIIFGGCTDKKLEQQNPNEVVDLTDTTAAVDTSFHENENKISVDDTIKALKVVYILGGGGAYAYSAMNYESIIYNSTIDFAQELEVLQEFTEWYKVRVTFDNRATFIYFIPKKSTTPTNPLTTVLFYPNYTVELKGFQISTSLDLDPSLHLNENVYYDGPPAYKVNNTEIYLDEDRKSYNLKKILLIKPKNKKDKFKVSFSINQFFNEILNVTDSIRMIKYDNYKYLSWSEFSQYQYINDSSNFFKIPKNDETIRYKIESDNIQQLKKKYNLKDTSVTIKVEGGDYEPYDIGISLTKDKKLIQYGLNEFLYLKIERIVNGKIVETRFIILGPDIGC